MAKEGFKAEQTGSLERLSESEVQNVLNEIDDSRVRGNLDAEHFVIDAGGGRLIYTPKRRFVELTFEGGKAEKVAISTHIQSILDGLSSS